MITFQFTPLLKSHFIIISTRSTIFRLFRTWTIRRHSVVWSIQHWSLLKKTSLKSCVRRSRAAFMKMHGRDRLWRKSSRFWKKPSTYHPKQPLQGFLRFGGPSSRSCQPRPLDALVSHLYIHEEWRCRNYITYFALTGRQKWFVTFF